MSEKDFHAYGELCAVLITIPAVAAENDLKVIIAQHWQIAKEFTLAVAEAMPAERYKLKPNLEELRPNRHAAPQHRSSGVAGP